MPSFHKDSLRVKLLVATKSKSERERGESFCGVAAAAKGIKIVACRRTTRAEEEERGTVCRLRLSNFNFNRHSSRPS